MELHDSSGNVLRGDDDSGNSQNARIIYDINSGRTYRIRLRELNHETGGSYRIRASLSQPNTQSSTTPNTQTAVQGSSASPIPLQADGSWTAQTISLPETWFTLTSSSAGSLTVETDGDLDTVMELYDNSGAKLKEDDDGSENGLNAQIQHDVRAGSTYRVKVWEYDRKTDVSYRIRATLSQPNAQNSTTVQGSSASPIPLQADGSWTTQTISLPETWFTLTPSTAGSLTLETDGDLDTVMELYDNSGTKLKDDDDGSGNGLNARIQHDVSAGSTYRVKVWEFDRKTGMSYRIRAAM
jgi:hypothetical protein